MENEPQQIPTMEKGQKYEKDIVGVFLGMENLQELEFLIKIKELEKEKKRLKLEEKNSGKDRNK